ncbi:MAG: DUF4399 domain-containing protein [Hydrogenophaga sp.]|uniref:DUF4399 domain-containing protein n=1 Tax=Hydrogenophaga sp. TaxID=1904254 RepID=UPI003D0AAB81
MQHHSYVRFLAPILLATVVSAATAQAPGAPDKPHPWQTPPPRLTAEAYFTNLKDGDQIETPFLLKFGLSGGWGLAPIAQPGRARSGHHHLLVNRELPLNFKEALPFNEQYIHFGKGQMETVLTLAPGTYTLRMLLADQKHLPHFVYSKPATITVTKKNSVDPASLSVKGLSLGLDGPVVKAPFRVQFHASALNVAHQAQKIPDTGHFRLTATPATGTPTVIDFPEGQTEVWLAPPAGSYNLRLEMVDNLDASRRMGSPTSASVRVE